MDEGDVDLSNQSFLSGTGLGNHDLRNCESDTVHANHHRGCICPCHGSNLDPHPSARRPQVAFRRQGQVWRFRHRARDKSPAGTNVPSPTYVRPSTCLHPGTSTVTGLPTPRTSGSLATVFCLDPSTTASFPRFCSSATIFTSGYCSSPTTHSAWFFSSSTGPSSSFHSSTTASATTAASNCRI